MKCFFSFIVKIFLFLHMYIFCNKNKYFRCEIIHIYCFYELLFTAFYTITETTATLKVFLWNSTLKTWPAVFWGFFLSIQSNKCNVFLFVFLIYSTYHPVLIIFTRIICNALDGVKSTVNLHMQYSGVIKTSLAFGLKMLNVLFLSKIFIYTYTDFNYTQLINKWIKGK